MGATGIAETTDDLNQAISVIDSKLGEGYAKANPQLLAAFLNSVSRYENNFGAGLVEELSGAMYQLAESLSVHAEAMNEQVEE